MATINRKYLTAELTDGRIVEVRLLFADQVQLSKTAKARRWGDDYASNPESNAFLYWVAARREGVLDESVTWEVFLTDWLVDLAFRDEDADTNAGDGTAADPTQAATN